MRRTPIINPLVFVFVAFLLVIDPPAFAETRVATFDEFEVGDLITTELECTQGLVFPYGAEVVLDPIRKPYLPS
jgi:hypothetical protein